MYEYKVREEEIKNLVALGEFAQAAEIADTIDWRRVKSVMMLCTVSDIYKINRRYEDARDMLLLAYERRPGGRNICYALCELYIKTEEIVQAVEYYKEFVQVAPRDPGRFILLYKIYEAQEVSLEERIEVLEELKKRDYREKWAYELAYLYHRVGLETRCVEECDEMILWFGEGPYVIKAMELKMLHQPLSAEQQEKYDHRFEDKTQAQTDEDESETSLMEDGGLAEEDKSGEDAGQEIYEDAVPDGDTKIFEFVTVRKALGLDTPEQAENVNVAGTSVPEVPVQETPVQLAAVAEPAAEPDEMDIQVKMMDVGEYNTINLQAELAEGLREILDAEPSDNEREDLITRSIMAPLMEEDDEDGWEDIEEDFGEVAENAQALEPESEAVEEAAIAETVTAEYAVEPAEVEQSTESETIWQFVETAAAEQSAEDESAWQDAEPAEVEQSTESETIWQFVETVAAEQTEATKTEVVGEIADKQAEAVEKPAPVAPVEPPKEIAHVLSQESDGQISFVLPESSAIEKQITGQMSIEDILAEWERMKKQNEEKHKEELRQRVLQQTGNMFTEFEAAVRDGLLEQLEKGEYDPEDAEDVIENTYEDVTEDMESIDNAEVSEEAAEIGEETENIAEFEELGDVSELEEMTELEELAEPETVAEFEDLGDVAEIEEGMESAEFGESEEFAEPEGTMEFEAVEEFAEIDEPAEEDGTDGSEETDEVEEIAEIEETIESDAEDITAPETAEMIADSGEEETAEEITAETAGETEESTSEETAAEAAERTSAETAVEAAETDMSEEDETDEEEDEDADGTLREKVRSMTSEELEMYASYIQSKKTKDQIVKAVDNVSLAAYTGNVIITGEEGMDTLTLAKNMIHEAKTSDGNFSGKTAKISGMALNKKSVEETVGLLQNGALIIQRACGMNEETVQSLYRVLQRENLGIVVFLEDRKKAMNKFLEANPQLLSIFTARIDVEAMSNDELVAFGKKYAYEKEYSIDNFGVLALHTRIEELQTIDHAVTAPEVKSMVDEAIRNANRKTPGHFFDILFAKRYDEEDMIILTERDFA